MLQATPPYMPDDAPNLFSGLGLPGRGGGGMMGVRRRPQADNLDAAPQLQPEDTPRPGDSLQTPNRDMVQQQDPAARAATGATPVSFDPQMDPMIQRIINQQNAVEDLQNEANMMEAAYRPSRLRNILATIAGIGTGALTMNPMAGAAMRKNVNEVPLHEAQQPIMQQIGQRMSNEKSLGEISGLQATLAQRNAQMDEARAAGQSAGARTREVAATEQKNQYDQEHPETSAETYTRPGESTPSVNMVPKRMGTSAQPAKLGAAKPDAGQFQVEVSADGKSMVQVNKTTGETKNVPLPTGTQLNSQQVSDMQKYVNASLVKDPKMDVTKAMDKYLNESRPNFGLETHGVTKAENDAEDSSAESTAASISSAIAKLGVKDPTEAYNRFNDTLDKLLARRKDLAKVADKIRAAGKAKYPGAGRKETSSGYKPGDIKAQSEGK